LAATPLSQCADSRIRALNRPLAQTALPASPCFFWITALWTTAFGDLPEDIDKEIDPKVWW